MKTIYLLILRLIDCAVLHDEHLILKAKTNPFLVDFLKIQFLLSDEILTKLFFIISCHLSALFAFLNLIFPQTAPPHLLQLEKREKEHSIMFIKSSLLWNVLA